MVRRYETKELRNIALIAHGGAGKTTLAEAILFDAGVTDRLGKVDEGASVMDYEPEEIKRHITITSSFHNAEWNGHKINLVDTPGDANFIADTKNSLQIVEGAILIIDATSGVQVQTEKVWQYAQELGIASVIFVNKMDRERAEFFGILEEIKRDLGTNPVAVQLPIGSEASFKGVIDLLRMKVLNYEDGIKERYREADIPEDLKDKAETFRANMIESIAEVDDQLLEKYLEEGLTFDEILGGFKKGVKEGELVPVLCGSALKNIGVEPLLDLIVKLLPSPLEKGEWKGINSKTQREEERNPFETEPFSAFVFKTIADPYAGKLNLFRVCSGILNSDSMVHNSSRGIKERIGQIFEPQGKTQRAINPAVAGDIVAVAKLKETTTGDTLSDEKNPIVFKGISLPNPVISFAVEPKSKGDEDKMTSSLARFQEEDPTLRVYRDEETKEMILSGMGQVHLEVVVEKLKRKFGVEVELKTPRVPYKETITSQVKVQGKYKKQSGGRGQYGDTWLEMEPLPRGQGFEFVNKIVGGVIPKQYISSVEKGVLEAVEKGVLAGFPVIDVKVSLVDGSYHIVDSSDIAFKIAASMGFREGVLKANPVLLEPIMSLEVISPDESLGDVIGDLNSKRGRVSGVEPKTGYQVIRAQVPLAEILRYAIDLRSITGGKGSFAMEFSHYEEVPSFLVEKLTAQAKGEKK